jgi:hypothetical protein
MPAYYHRRNDHLFYELALHPLDSTRKYIERETIVPSKTDFHLTPTTPIWFNPIESSTFYFARIMSMGSEFIRIRILLPFSDRKLDLQRGEIIYAQNELILSSSYLTRQTHTRYRHLNDGKRVRWCTTRDDDEAKEAGTSLTTSK